MQSNNLQYLKGLFDSGCLEVCKGEENTYFLSIDDSYIKLNKNFHDLLEIIKNQPEENLSFVCDSKEFNTLCEIIKDRSDRKVKDSYIYFKVNLLSKKLVNIISGHLSFLFKEKVFATVFLLVFFLNGVFYINHFQATKVDLSLSDLWVYYVLLIFIMIMHEFGHASASKYFGIRPNHIGFGFYLFFPVFFANVTNIWLLSKKKRIVVNLGGIYFQLIANLLLILINLYSESGLIVKIINVNFFVACYSLIPFLRNDGYWIYSDAFNLPNLSSRSKFYYLNVFENLVRKKKLDKINFPLFLYSIGNSLFLAVILLYYFKAIGLNINKILIANSSWEIVKNGVFILVISFFFIMFLKRHITNLFNQIKFYSNGKRV